MRRIGWCLLVLAAAATAAGCAGDNGVGEATPVTMGGDAAAEAATTEAVTATEVVPVTTVPVGDQAWLSAPVESLDLCKSLSLETTSGFVVNFGPCEPSSEWPGGAHWPGSGYGLSVFVIDSGSWGGDTADRGRSLVEGGQAIEVPGTGALYAWAAAENDQAIADFGSRVVVVELNGDSIPVQPSNEQYAEMLTEVVAYLG
jgi:hypothetical protein